MTFERIGRIASDFNSLAVRFEEFARRATKPQHLLIDVEQTATRAGALLQLVASEGAFEGDGWWRDGRSPVHPHEGDAGSYTRYSSDAEFHRVLWSHAISGWLVKRCPDRFRHRADTWDWTRTATDASGRPLGRDGQPLRKRWFRDGAPLPDDFDGNLLDPEFGNAHPHGEYEWRYDGVPAYKHEFYDVDDALAHLRIRAEVYADACRVVAELLDRAVKPALVAELGGLGSMLDSKPLHRIAARLESLATQEEPAAVVAAQAGGLLREARAAGALSAIDWPELDCCFQGYDSSNGGTLNAARRLFVCVAERLAKSASSMARELSFRTQPQHPRQALDWNWVSESIRLVASLLRSKVSPGVARETEMLTVTKAAQLLQNDWPGLTLKHARSRVSKAASSGQFETNGETRTRRRIEVGSFSRWRLVQRDRNLDAADADEAGARRGESRGVHRAGTRKRR